MAYEVIARKWRPQNFDEVVHQKHVSRTLLNSILKERVHHSYIFSGPRGVGKTTMARILAKALNCLNADAGQPCGECENCREIVKGSSFDVIEIDGASNRGIDDIRELRENVNFAPVKSKYKVYIVDEVHMVTTPGFNALLKTLEEPPRNVIFIFATTEFHKIPDTIVSRCQKFFFKAIPVESIVDHLKYIIDREGFSITEKAVYPIARASEGSMRDAQSLLDQVLSFSEKGESADNAVSEDDVLSILGIVPLDSYLDILNHIIAHDAAALIREIENVVAAGGDIPRYVEGFTEVIRFLRLVKNGVKEGELLGLSGEEVNKISGIAEKFHDEELSLIFNILNELQYNLKNAGAERINLEMALLDMISAVKMPSIASILKKIDTSKSLNHEIVDDGDDGDDKPVNPGADTSLSADPTIDRIKDKFHGEEVNKGD